MITITRTIGNAQYEFRVQVWRERGVQGAELEDVWREGYYVSPQEYKAHGITRDEIEAAEDDALSVTDHPRQACRCLSSHGGDGECRCE